MSMLGRYYWEPGISDRSNGCEVNKINYLEPCIPGFELEGPVWVHNVFCFKKYMCPHAVHWKVLETMTNAVAMSNSRIHSVVFKYQFLLKEPGFLEKGLISSLKQEMYKQMYQKAKGLLAFEHLFKKILEPSWRDSLCEKEKKDLSINKNNNSNELKIFNHLNP